MNGRCCSPGRHGPDGIGGGIGSAGADGAAGPVAGAAQAPGPRPGAEPPSHAVRLPGGTFRMGSDEGLGHPDDEEGPVRAVTVGPFAVATTTVTTARWAEFAEETGHVSDAERFGWSHVFHLHLPPAVAARAARVRSAPWWCAVRGADWRHPEGPGSDLAGRDDHPAVHVSWRDAQAWCAWAGGRLPTEAEWEYAARGGLQDARYPWGDEPRPGGEHRCNIWQGGFPWREETADGWAGTAPVTTYAPNGFGLFQTVGNVWEWCADRRHGGRVIKGGSFLCHDAWCDRYRVAARSANEEDASAANAGFRCVWDPPGPDATGSGTHRAWTATSHTE
ncbi:formylglycine-generating enzyme family protein [Streptomyces halstedii]|uniref:formylglycine-generating enzyme family protein n=1 Tax=Streptomyces TaxID=1883 RepID=UPI0004A95994|nr:hypothetical protein DT87_23465 [Streptomyces sp. NTK 937]